MRALDPPGTSPVPIVLLHDGAAAPATCSSAADMVATSEGLQPLLERVVERAGGAAASVHLRTVNPQPPMNYDDEDDWGGLGHWSVHGHRKYAAGLVPHIAEIMGWTPSNL